MEVSTEDVSIVSVAYSIISIGGASLVGSLDRTWIESIMDFANRIASKPEEVRPDYNNNTGLSCDDLSVKLP